jgi:Na+/melibiose symporter-like transporter
MGGIVLSILLWESGFAGVGALLAVGIAGLIGLVFWLRSRKRREKATLLDPDLFKSKLFRFGVSGQLFQQIALGGTMIVIPLYLQMVLEYSAFLAGLTLTPLSLTMFAVAAIMGKRVGRRRPASVIRFGYVLLLVGLVLLLPIVPRADTGWWLVIPLLIAGGGLGLLVSQLNNYTLSPVSNERVSEAASVNSAAGSFGLSFGLAFGGAILLASLSTIFTGLSNSSEVLSTEQKEQTAQVLEEDAQFLSNTALEDLLSGQPEPIQDEIIRINTEARPIALQLALLVPILAALLGLIVSFRMMRLPDPKPSGAAEGMLLG